MVTLWCLQFSLKQPELCYWHRRLPIQGNAVKFISVLSTPNKSSKQGTIWQIRPWKCGFSMWTVKLLKSWMITAGAFSSGISYSYTCHSLVHPAPPFLSFSLSLFFHSFVSFLFGWAAVSGKKQPTLPKPIRHFYNALLLVGKRGREEQRLMGKDDICGGCVPTLL